ncbi:MAG: YbhB/YbcL family Raf kinase inhibitor-like protein [bacterium]|nr:MAG: YbhB/YbcL family Raf kinase inhibitor-like protein [bacterium]
MLYLASIPACSGQKGTDEKATGKGGAKMDIMITSPAFANNGPIPTVYTCDGENISPPIQWSGLPEETRSLALICDDPDAPMKTWVHWVLYCIPPDCAELGEGVPNDEIIANGAKHGSTDFGSPGYGGPCPPRGKPHRYFFKLYALDTMPDLEPGLTKKALLKSMKGHILASGELIGTYQRK